MMHAWAAMLLAVAVPASRRSQQDDACMRCDGMAQGAAGAAVQRYAWPRTALHGPGNTIAHTGRVQAAEVVV